MIERRWGRVLTIVSDAGRRGERKQVVYGAAKAAAMGFSRGLAAEVGRDGVTVNCIALGTMHHGAAGRGDRAAARARGEAGAQLPGRPDRAGRRPGAARGAALQRRGGVDHRPGVPGRRRLRVRRSDGRHRCRAAHRLHRARTRGRGTRPRSPRSSKAARHRRLRRARLHRGGPARRLDAAALRARPTTRGCSPADRSVIGYAYVWESQPDAELEADAFVLPEYAGRGLGGQLLDLIESRAPRASAPGGR